MSLICNVKNDNFCKYEVFERGKILKIWVHCVIDTIRALESFFLVRKKPLKLFLKSTLNFLSVLYFIEQSEMIIKMKIEKWSGDEPPTEQ